DRALVLGRRVDGEAVVAALVGQVVDHDPKRLAAQPAVLVRGRQAEVEPSVAGLGVVLLGDQQDARQVVFDLDGERLHARIVDQLAAHAVGIVIAPPAGDLRLGEHRRDGVDVLRRRVTEKNALASELLYAGDRPTLASGQRLPGFLRRMTANSFSVAWAASRSAGGWSAIRNSRNV